MGFQSFHKQIKQFLAYVATTQLHKVAVLLTLALLGVGMGVGFSVATTQARDAADADASRCNDIFSQWQMGLTSYLTQVQGAAASLASFAVTSATTPTNMSAPPADRMVVIDDDGFQRVAADTYVPGVTFVVLAPGGVITQGYPIGAANIGNAVLDSKTYVAVRKRLLEAFQPTVSGPNPYTSRPGFGMVAWNPIFTSANKSVETFWGVSFAAMEVEGMMEALNAPALKRDHNLDYVLWYTVDHEGNIPQCMHSSNHALNSTIMQNGLVMTLPVSEPGRQGYFAIYPEGGFVSAKMTVGLAVTMVAVVLVGTAVVVGCVYGIALLQFLYRHRNAPASKSRMFIAALTLRGAQPIADRDPLEAVRMFSDFTTTVRERAVEMGCYPVCDIGDRAVLVVCKEADKLATLCQQVVGKIVLQALSSPPQHHEVATVDHTSQHSYATTNHSKVLTQSNRPTHEGLKRVKSRASPFSKTADETSMVSSSFIGTALCRPCAAMHTVASNSYYDAARDAYFCCNAAQLGKLCGVVDGLRGGEVGWSDAFDDDTGDLCRAMRAAAVACHTVSENGAVRMHVASLWREMDGGADDRDNEDPSVAMAAVADAYLRRMTTIVSDGRGGGTKGAGSKGRGEGDSSKASNKTADATSITRSATLLHVMLLGTDQRPLDAIRRIVAEEKGAVVSAHEGTVVAAYNLLAPGGHHAVRAAETVTRLVAALPADVPFVCSIASGKVSALIVDGLVMCSGEVVTAGKLLVERAAASAISTYAACNSKIKSGLDSVVAFDALLDVQAIEGKSAILGDAQPNLLISPSDRGLCYLLNVSELSAAYDCEAVDVLSFLGCGPPCSVSYSVQHQASVVARKLRRAQAGQPSKVDLLVAAHDEFTGDLVSKPTQRIVYRLAGAKGAKADDEWMYQLRDEEDASPHAAVNAVFIKIAAGEFDDARKIWKHECSGGGIPIGVSTHSASSIGEHLLDWK